MDKRASSPEEALKNRQDAARRAREAAALSGVKPGPKMFANADEFFDYWIDKIERDRSPMDVFVKAYCKQPIFIRAQAANHEKMEYIVKVLWVDCAFGVYKPMREQCAPLNKLFDHVAKMEQERERSSRKRINKEDAKRDKSNDMIMTSLNVSTEDE